MGFEILLPLLCAVLKLFNPRNVSISYSLSSDFRPWLCFALDDNCRTAIYFTASCVRRKWNQTIIIMIAVGTSILSCLCRGKDDAWWHLLCIQLRTAWQWKILDKFHKLRRTIVEHNGSVWTWIQRLICENEKKQPPGPDYFSPTIFAIGARCTSIALANIFRLSVQYGTFPFRRKGP